MFLVMQVVIRLKNPVKPKRNTLYLVNPVLFYRPTSTGFYTTKNAAEIYHGFCFFFILFCREWLEILMANLNRLSLKLQI